MLEKSDLMCLLLLLAEAEPSPSPMEEDYEGVDGAQQHTGNGSLVTKSINWENLTKSVKPGDIDGVISKGNYW